LKERRIDCLLPNDCAYSVAWSVVWNKRYIGPEQIVTKVIFTKGHSPHLKDQAEDKKKRALLWLGRGG